MSGTVVSIGVAAVGVAVIAAAAGVGAASVVAQRVAGAADAAALAAADAASGAVVGVPCDRAGQVSSAMGARMHGCELAELIATVSVSVPFGAFEVTATARAGPPP